MIVNGTPATELNYDRKTELTAFNKTKTGVKLVDAEITKVPRIFVVPSPEILNSDEPSLPERYLLTIDLEGMNEDPSRWKEVIEKVKDVLGGWGFFQMVNHGIPVSMLDEMLKGVFGFLEEDSEVKKCYTRDLSGKHRVVYNSNFDLYSVPVTNWTGSFHFTMAPNPPQPHELPPRSDILMEYSKKVMKLGCCVFELIYEALGLNPNHLVEIGCAEGLVILGHYYPSCPQPELTKGTPNHAHNDFMTILLQDHIGGLQDLYKNEWVNVPPIP